MRRIKALILCVVFLIGGCKTFHHVSDIVAIGAFVVGAAYLNHHYDHGHNYHYHGHNGHSH